MKAIAAVVCLCTALFCLAEPPLRWIVPEGFNPKTPGLGLQQLDGIENEDIYAPLPSKAAISEGGNGVYESTLHGTYNHHQQIVVIDNHIIVYWTNHLRDENGPGQRLLARVGTFSADGSRVDWGNGNTVQVLASPAMPASRRPEDDSSPLIDTMAVNGYLMLVKGRLFLRGNLFFCNGWTDSTLYHSQNTAPIPDEHYRPKRDKNFRFDIFWKLATFIQEWKVENGRLAPVSDVYIQGGPIRESMQITPTINKKIAPLLEPYASAKLLSTASADFQQAWRGPETVFHRYPKYAPNTMKLAADGLNGLAHYTEFIRPDGTYVTVRDNLLATETYYAAAKKTADDCYPPAEKTNLFGTAMPVAGELPDGRVWIVGSDLWRQNAYLTWSADGITFDHTKLLLHLNYEATPGICKGRQGGAQYFKSIIRGNNIWIVYSVAKEKVGIMRIPAEALK